MNTTANKPTTLLSLLEYMKELADKGMEKEPAFGQTHDAYCLRLIREPSSKEKEDAIRFLKQAGSIGPLSTENMIEVVEGYDSW